MCQGEELLRITPSFQNFTTEKIMRSFIEIKNKERKPTFWGGLGGMWGKISSVFLDILYLRYL